jgi:uncharacterized membrane protein
MVFVMETSCLKQQKIENKSIKLLCTQNNFSNTVLCIVCETSLAYGFVF